jgi:glycosyltransferase involved in cell wall biosynthesis
MNQFPEIPDLEIIVPCFNEAGILSELINNCSRISKIRNIKFIIVNNGSTDESDKIFHKFENTHGVKFITLEVNQGYGGGIYEGMTHASSPFVGWMHGDMQIGLDSLLELPNKLQGSVIYKGRRRGRKLTDALVTSIMGLLCSLILQKNLKDINAQPTVIDRNLLFQLERFPINFNFDLFVYFMALNSDYKVHNIAVKVKPRRFGESKWNVNFRSRFRMSVGVLAYSVFLRRMYVNN